MTKSASRDIFEKESDGADACLTREQKHVCDLRLLAQACVGVRGIVQGDDTKSNQNSHILAASL
jgi:hypothetical protein